MNTQTPNRNPQTTPEKQQTAPDKPSPLHPGNPSSPGPDSAPSTPEGDRPKQDQDKQDRNMKSQGKVSSAVAIAGVLAFTGMGIGALNSAHAEPTTPVTSTYCTQLAAQYDKSLSLHAESEHLDEANRGRSLGWEQCAQGESSQGEMTLRTAIRRLGIAPVSKNAQTRN